MRGQRRRGSGVRDVRWGQTRGGGVRVTRMKRREWRDLTRGDGGFPEPRGKKELGYARAERTKVATKW